MNNDRQKVGKRLAEDLRRIREERGIDLARLIEITKMPLDLVEQFERDGLAGHPVYNRVYLRSFAKSYAGVLGIDETLTVKSVEEMLAGTYNGALARRYLGETGSPEATAEPAEATAEPAEPEASTTADAHEKHPRDRERPKAETTAKPVPAVIPAVPARGSSKGALLTPDLLRWVGVVALIVVVLVAVTWVALSWGEAEPPPPPVAEQVRPEVVPPLPPRIEPVALGDSIQIRIIAARDTLNPIRVTADGGVRRPYWIEISDTLSVLVADRLTIERHLNDLALDVLGYPIATDSRDSLGRLLVTRDEVQRQIDALRGL